MELKIILVVKIFLGSKNVLRILCEVVTFGHNRVRKNQNIVFNAAKNQKKFVLIAQYGRKF